MGDRLIAVGGYDGNNYLRTVEAYDLESNEWSQVSPLTYSRAGACVVTIPNVIPPSAHMPSSTVG